MYRTFQVENKPYSMISEILQNRTLTHYFISTNSSLLQIGAVGGGKRRYHSTNGLPFFNFFSLSLVFFCCCCCCCLFVFGEIKWIENTCQKLVVKEDLATASCKEFFFWFIRLKFWSLGCHCDCPFEGVLSQKSCPLKYHLQLKNMAYFL